MGLQDGASGRTLGRILFVSDVHLRPEGAPLAAELSARFAGFLDEAASSAERGDVSALYVLGDLFDYWFEPRGRIPTGFRGDCDRIRRATSRGLAVTVLPGNRDFLLGPAFERATGAAVAPEELELRLVSAGRATRVLLAHGDSLVSRDRRYQVWRRFSRSAGFRRVASSLPEAACTLLARLARRGSEFEKGMKPRDSMAYSETALRALVARGFDSVVAAHVHEALEREIAWGGRRCRLIALGSWERGGGEFAEWDGLRLRLVGR